MTTTPTPGRTFAWAAIVAPFDTPDPAGRTLTRGNPAGWTVRPGAPLLALNCEDTPVPVGAVERVDALHPAHLIACGTFTAATLTEARTLMLLAPVLDLHYTRPDTEPPFTPIGSGTVRAVRLTPPDRAAWDLPPIQWFAVTDRTPEQAWAHMTAVLAGWNAAAGPFTPGDPVNYDELTGEQRAWRTVLHLLATTCDPGHTLHFPPQYPPNRTALTVAAGWRYHVNTLTTAAGTALSADLTGYPEGADPDTIRRYLTRPTYPYVNADGVTVWACCLSTLGPPCPHRAGTAWEHSPPSAGRHGHAGQDTDG